jgi:hypothetical protein
VHVAFEHDWPIPHGVMWPIQSSMPVLSGVHVGHTGTLPSSSPPSSPFAPPS